jgi:hypothetical protein
MGEKIMSYNKRTDKFSCDFCGTNTGCISLKLDGCDEDGNHLNPFSCLKILKERIEVFENREYFDNGGSI